MNTTRRTEDPSSVTASAVTPSPKGEGFGAGKIVAEYRTPGGVVRISDAGFAGKTPEQRERDRRQARAVALEILGRAVERGAVEGITPEEWRQRYG